MSITRVIESSRPNRSSLVICLLLALIAAALRIPSLASRGYSLDEAWTAEIASGRGSIHLNLPRDVVMPMPVFFNLGTKADVPWWHIWTKMECTHPPLYFLGLRFWTDLIGPGDAPERSFSILAALISVVLLFDVVRLCNGRSIAIWACILFALAQPQIQYARETRNYTWLIACALFAADALVRVEKFGPNIPRLSALSVGVLATLLTHYFGIGMLIGLGLYAILRTRGRVRANVLIAFALAILIFAICWGPYMWQQRALASTSDQSTNFLLDKPDTHLAWTFYRLALLPGVLLAEPRGAAVYICYAGVALYILPLIALRLRPDLLIWILWMFGVIGVIAALDFSRDTHHLGLIRYTLLAGPAVYVLIPALVSQLPPWLRHAVPAIAGVYCLWALPHTYQSAVADPKVIAAQVQSAARPQDLLLFISTGKNEWWAGGQCMVFSRYLKLPQCPVALLNAPAGAEVTDRALASHRVFGFTVAENPADFVHGIFPQDMVKFPGQGKVWILQKEISPQSRFLFFVHPAQIMLPKIHRFRPRRRLRPSRRVLYHFQHPRIVIRRKRLMPGPKIRDLPQSARPRTAASKNFATSERADQKRALRLGDIKEFAVHLLALDHKMIVDVLHDRMPRPRHPQRLALSRVAPFQIARSPHQLLKYLGKMPAVKHNQSHPLEHPPINHVHHRVVHLAVRHVAPPEHHVRIVNHFLAQPVFWLVQRRGANFQSLAFPQM
jgi:uncharacterized membrane protein